jgi:hypothetical protein
MRAGRTYQEETRPGNVASAAPSQAWRRAGRTAMEDFGARRSPASGRRPRTSVCDRTEAAKPPASANNPRDSPDTGAAAGQKHESRPARGGAGLWRCESAVISGCPRRRECARRAPPCRRTAPREATRGRRRATSLRGQRKRNEIHEHVHDGAFAAAACTRRDADDACGDGRAAVTPAERARNALSVTRIDDPDMAAAAISGVT